MRVSRAGQRHSPGPGDECPSRAASMGRVSMPVDSSVAVFGSLVTDVTTLAISALGSPR